jgi:hypothetical protein
MRTSPMSMVLKIGILPLVLMLILGAGMVSTAQEPLPGESEYCLPGGVADIFDLEGAAANQSHSIVVRNFNTTNSLLIELSSGESKADQPLGPGDRVTIPFTPGTDQISMMVDNTANTGVSCVIAYIKEVSLKNIELNVPQRLCVAANQSIGKFLSEVQTSGVYRVAIQNASAENALIVSHYGSGVVRGRNLAVKANLKAVLNVFAVRNGPLYLRLNNLDNATETCIDVTLSFVGTATPVPTLPPIATLPGVNPTPRAAVLNSCVPGSQQNRLIELGDGRVGYRYTVIVSNASTENTISIYAYTGTTVTQIFNLAPLKATAFLLSPAVNRKIYLAVDNRGNRTASCIRAILSARLISGGVSPTPVAPGPTPTRATSAITKCADARKLTTGTAVGTAVADKAHTILVTNLSKTNTITITFVRGRGRSNVYNVNPGKSSVITLRSTTSGVLTMEMDNRGNTSQTCVIVIMSK